MSDADVLALRVQLARTAEALAAARSQRDPYAVVEELARARAALDRLLNDLSPAPAPTNG